MLLRGAKKLRRRPPWSVDKSGKRYYWRKIGRFPMTHQSPFVLMRGMDILAFLRDSVADEAERKRTFIQQCEAIAEGSTHEQDRQRVRALQGAADALTFIIGAGQDARLRSETGKRGFGPPRFDAELLEIITKCANQARVALVESKPDLDELEEKENLINLG